MKANYCNEKSISPWHPLNIHRLNNPVFSANLPLFVVSLGLTT